GPRSLLGSWGDAVTAAQLRGAAPPALLGSCSDPSQGCMQRSGQRRGAREARGEARPRAGWARLLQDPPGRRHKGLHKKGLGKGCFGLKLDRIGAMSGLGC
uniref:C-type natriuretic peptide n=1 Tax=Amazona collaria TaxID=241587 RepID=A0A8B9IW95_9PSIT